MRWVVEAVYAIGFFVLIVAPDSVVAGIRARTAWLRANTARSSPKPDKTTVAVEVICSCGWTAEVKMSDGINPFDVVRDHHAIHGVG